MITQHLSLPRPENSQQFSFPESANIQHFHNLLKIIQNFTAKITSQKSENQQNSSAGKLTPYATGFSTFMRRQLDHPSAIPMGINLFIQLARKTAPFLTEAATKPPWGRWTNSLNWPARESTELKRTYPPKEPVIIGHKRTFGNQTFLPFRLFCDSCYSWYLPFDTCDILILYCNNPQERNILVLP